MGKVISKNDKKLATLAKIIQTLLEKDIAGDPQ